MKFGTVKSGWSIVYIEVIIKKNIVFLFLKIDLVLANSTDPDEMHHSVAFHLDLHCLQKYLFWCWQSIKG